MTTVLIYLISIAAAIFCGTVACVLLFKKVDQEIKEKPKLKPFNPDDMKGFIAFNRPKDWKKRRSA